MKTLPSNGRSGGFTLIELVIVVILLGILAIIAAPKFINLTKDSRQATLSQLQASVKSINMMVLAKANMPSLDVRPVNNRDDLLDVDLEGNGSFDTRLKYGYLDNTDVIKRLDIDQETLIQQTVDQDKLYIGFDLNSDGDVINDSCYFLYTQATASSTPPQYAITDSGC